MEKKLLNIIKKRITKFRQQLCVLWISKNCIHKHTYLHFLLDVNPILRFITKLQHFVAHLFPQILTRFYCYRLGKALAFTCNKLESNPFSMIRIAMSYLKTFHIVIIGKLFYAKTLLLQFVMQLFPHILVIFLLSQTRKVPDFHKIQTKFQSAFYCQIYEELCEIYNCVHLLNYSRWHVSFK